MPTSKYKTKNGQIRWRSKCMYTDPKTGKRKQHKKEGFCYRREAEDYEREFLMRIKTAGSVTELMFDDFVERFIRDTEQTLALSTRQTRNYRIKNHILGSFQKSINKITVADLQNWVNSLPEYGFSAAYTKTLYTQMRIIFNHAERVYGLSPNPVKSLRPPPVRERKHEMNIWTYNDFCRAISVISNLKAKTAITLLFYTGLRKGELYALEWNDIKDNIVSVTKSLQRIGGRSIVTPPKTHSSIRELLLPRQALDALSAWRGHELGDFIFSWEKRFIELGIREAVAKAGVKPIRVHDLRHSHVSYLISKGANIKLISKRLGHTKTSMTLDIYGHLYPSDEQKLIDLIERDGDAPKPYKKRTRIFKTQEKNQILDKTKNKKARKIRLLKNGQYVQKYMVDMMGIEHKVKKC